MWNKIKTKLLSLEPDILDSVVLLATGLLVIVLGLLLILSLQVTLWTTI